MENKSNMLYMKIKKELLDRIGDLEPNQRIPSRNELIKQYNVTRTTIDRAISEMIGEGYLYTIDGSGTYKSDRKEQLKQNDDNNIESWAVILPDIMHDTYPGILRGVEDVASENGKNVVICNTDNLIEKQNFYIYKLLDSDVRGIIIVPAIIGQGNDLMAYEKLNTNHIPFVFCNRGVSGVEAPLVMSNNFYGAYLATNHLIKQGYKNIAFVSRPMYSAALDRYQGYMSALAQAGLTFNQNYVTFERTFETENSGYEITKNLLISQPEVDGIFCFNDVVAQGAYQAIIDLGKEVGSDIGLVGYDNTSICEMLHVKLTSVSYRNYEIGNKAAHILLEMTKEDYVSNNTTVVLQPELEIRKSSDKLLNLTVCQVKCDTSYKNN